MTDVSKAVSVMEALWYEMNTVCGQFTLRHGVWKRVLVLVLHVSIVEKQVLTATLPISKVPPNTSSQCLSTNGKAEAMKRMTF